MSPHWPTALKKLIVSTVRTEENLKLLGDSKASTNYKKARLWVSITESVNRVRCQVHYLYFAMRTIFVRCESVVLQRKNYTWHYRYIKLCLS